jgi:biopolymer transport protein ExbB/TolQ
MSRPVPGASRQAYPGTLALVAVAVALPIGLMVVNPTLMFERGWEQFAGTGFYFLALAILAREVLRLWADERAFSQVDAWLADPDAVPDADARILPSRIRGLARGRLSLAQVVELNREASALDQEHAAGRFTLPRYILYVLPVIGFIGTVEGISKALKNISQVLPLVKELDGFLSKLTGVTDALNLAFDSTLLALFLSSALMLVQTIVQRRSEDLLTRVDRWVVEHLLLRAAATEPLAAQASLLPPGLVEQLERIEQVLGTLADRIGPPIDRFADSIDRLPPSFATLEKSAESFGRLGDGLEQFRAANETARRGAATLSRIEAALAAGAEPDEQLDAIRRSVEQSNQAIEALAGQFAQAFERNSRSTQDQLARTLGSLKDALDLLNVSMEQGNALYRSIVKKMFPIHGANLAEERAA